MKPVMNRRKGREWALQMIVQADLNPDVDIDKMIFNFWDQQWSCHLESEQKTDEDMTDVERALMPAERLASTALREFTEKLVRGVLLGVKTLDKNIEVYSYNWSLYRIGVVERCVLRLAFYEMGSCKDVPTAVVINEAVDLAKYFSNTESGSFVNGILDRYRKDLGR